VPPARVEMAVRAARMMAIVMSGEYHKNENDYHF
jgi:hypothetical protein